jgi:hypothetical protein
MAKQTDFAKKAQKSSEAKGIKCPKCGGVKTPTLYVNAIKTSQGSFRFNRQRVNVCKCNEKEIFG